MDLLELGAGGRLTVAERPGRRSRQQQIVAFAELPRFTSRHFEPAAPGRDQAERDAWASGKSSRPIAGALALFPGEGFGPQQPDGLGQRVQIGDLE
jgi:hypothetical protein